MSKRTIIEEQKTLDTHADAIKTLVEAAWDELYVTSDLNDNHTAADLAFTNQRINNAFAALSRLRNIVNDPDNN